MLDGLVRDYDAVANAAAALSTRAAIPLAPPGFTASRRPTFAPGAMVPIAVGVQAALGLVSLFREDVGSRGAKTLVDPSAFELALAAKLKQKGAQRVIVPAFAARSSARWSRRRPRKGPRGRL